MFICYCLCTLILHHIERIKNKIESAIILSDLKHSPKWFCKMPTFWKLLLRMQIVSILEVGSFGHTPSCNSEHKLPMLCIWIIIYNYGQSEKQHYIMICDNKCGVMSHDLIVLMYCSWLFMHIRLLVKWTTISNKYLMSPLIGI